VLVANKAEGKAGARVLEASLGSASRRDLAEHGEGMATSTPPILAVAPEEMRKSGDQSRPHRHRRPAERRQVDPGQPLIGEDRMLTGPEAGITRDAIPVDWTWDERAVRLVDTAGLRRKAKVQEKLEKLSTTTRSARSPSPRS
jgi:GTP-binding protein